jgi:hypothetical protein
MSFELILRMRYIHRHLAESHRQCDEALSRYGIHSHTYIKISFEILSLEKEQAEILWKLADLSDVVPSPNMGESERRNSWGQ